LQADDDTVSDEKSGQFCEQIQPEKVYERDIPPKNQNVHFCSQDTFDQKRNQNYIPAQIPVQTNNGGVDKNAWIQLKSKHDLSRMDQFFQPMPKLKKKNKLLSQ